MDYVGKMVRHKGKYGVGRIVAQDGIYVTVQFDAFPEPKKFPAPACFASYLQLLDPEAAEQASTEVRKQEEIDVTRREQKEQELRLKIYAQRARKQQDDAKATVPYYSSLDDFFNDQERMIISEITYLRQNGGKRQRIVDGTRIEVKNGIYYYTFEADSEQNIPDNTQISLWQNDKEIPAVIVNCDEFTLTITTARNLGEKVPAMEFSAEPWRLLHFLIERLKSLRSARSPIAEALILKGKDLVKFDMPIVTGQDQAIAMSLKQPITFVWGPPGTGKTSTLAHMAIRHMKQGNRVLMLSYSNVSVDEALMRVFHEIGNAAPGRLIRYGYPRRKELLWHEYLTSYNLVLSKHPELVKEREKLIEERAHAPHTSAAFVDAGLRLSQIRKLLKTEEQKAVSEASFIATTVSKAIADNALYEDVFDTVIFDEASMAFIPQIVFAAGLAGKHFVCIGDFAQLPPIVQSSDSSALNADIFQYCGITDAVQAGHGHQWLCMLDTQYRMHPGIAAFSSKTMYRGLLKSAPGMREKRETVTRHGPMPGKALGMYDLSGMMSVCLQTGEKSRVNVLSAMISMGLAIKAAEREEVGIISPYSAQSRLLHAMARDISESHPELHKIECATVHQFQGSEKDAVIYDAVDCYRMPYPGRLLTSTTNNYANRLFNVALTRARGKMISVVNVDYMRRKSLSKSLVFQHFLEETVFQASVRGEQALESCESAAMRIGTGVALDREFLDDLLLAKNEVRIDIPGTVDGTEAWLYEFTKTLNGLRQKGIKVTLRAASKAELPEKLRPLAIENPYVANPVALIDKRITWFGLPHSGAQFISEGKPIPSLYRPIIRFAGRHFAQALYGFLEMNRTVDRVEASSAKNAAGRYDTFSAYVSGEQKCPDCHGPLRLKKGKTGRFFLGCSNYPKCGHTEPVTETMVDQYFYFDNPVGKLCPRDHTSLEPCAGKYGLFVRCNGLNRHTYRLDEV